MEYSANSKMSSSSRKAMKKVKMWLENHVSSHVSCACCKNRESVTDLNNTVTVCQEDYTPVPRHHPVPRHRPVQRHRPFQKNISTRRTSRKSTKIYPWNKPSFDSYTHKEGQSVISVSSAHELKTYMKNGFKCTLC